MKIEGPGRSQGPSKTKKTSESSSDGEVSFGDFVSGGTAEAAPSQPTHSIARVDVLLAVQETEDPTARAAKKRMRQRSTTILNELEGLRKAMLSGTLTVGHMIDIADVVASHREKIHDPVLTGIMDEIDLRAQVEIAKMCVALSKAG